MGAISLEPVKDGATVTKAKSSEEGQVTLKTENCVTWAQKENMLIGEGCQKVVSLITGWGWELFYLGLKFIFTGLSGINRKLYSEGMEGIYLFFMCLDLSPNNTC